MPTPNDKIGLEGIAPVESANPEDVRVLGFDANGQPFVQQLDLPPSNLDILSLSEAARTYHLTGHFPVVVENKPLAIVLHALWPMRIETLYHQTILGSANVEVRKNDTVMTASGDATSDNLGVGTLNFLSNNELDVGDSLIVVLKNLVNLADWMFTFKFVRTG